MASRIIAQNFRTGFVTLFTLTLLALAVYFFAPPRDIAERAALAVTTLEQARLTGKLEEHALLSKLPLPDIADPTHRKALFIAALLPHIVRENARIQEQRASAAVVPIKSTQYAVLAHAYGLDPDASRASLLRRIDSVPVSLALAQGAIESGWGTSRFARYGNAFYGERTYDPDVPGLTPQDAFDEGPAFKVKSFSSVALSVRSYMKTINTHKTYAALRQQRADLRARGIQPTGVALAPFLHGYSEIGDAYVMRIKAAIRINALSDYNEVQLASQ
jgi:Bax protein